jgi:Fe-Mn family superoxide dismutase
MNIERTNDRANDEGATTRRAFLGRGAVAGLSLAALGGWAHAAQNQDGAGGAAAGAMGGGADLFPGAMNAQGEFVLPPLPYDYNALEPHIDEETMRLHHDLHHAGYVRGLNAQMKAMADARTAGNTDMVEHHIKKASFHGGGHFLHCIFWPSMSPNPSSFSGELRQAIGRDFGSTDAWRSQFAAAAGSVEGSGWGILAWSIPGKRLVVTTALNHNHLLVVDVWEHAYYKRYSNRRGDYVQAFLGIVNWYNVGQRYAALRSALG